MDIKLTNDIDTIFKKEFKKIGAKQVPFATLSALNDTALQVRTSLYQHMKIQFDEPTHWTVPKNFEKASNKKGSLIILYANRNNLRASVMVKDKGQAPHIDYLKPQILGGSREAKSSELSLRSKGLISNNKFITPANITKNKFGNVSKSNITKVLSGLSALAGAPSGNVSKQKSKYFIISEGIWERRGKNLKKLFNIVNQPRYSKKILFNRVADNVIKLNIVKNFEKSLKYVLRTS